jgi:hypothetical protein
MRNVSDESYTENQNTHFNFYNFLKKLYHLRDNVVRYRHAGLATGDSSHCMTDTNLKATNTHLGYVILPITFLWQQQLHYCASVIRYTVCT